MGWVVPACAGMTVGGAGTVERLGAVLGEIPEASAGMTELFEMVLRVRAFRSCGAAACLSGVALIERPVFR